MRNPFGVTQSNLPDCNTFCNPGSDIYVMRQLAQDDVGRDYLQDVGKISISERINSFRDFTDMSYILARLAAGDASVLNVRNDAMYGDFTGMPYDPRAMLDTINNARNYFDHLPADVRAKFGDDFVAWFSDAGDPEWVSKMIKNPDTSAPVEEPKGDSE